MSISSKTRKLLWSRAHNACAICRKSLTVLADSDTRPGIVLGEEAHIIAQREEGPRGRDGDRRDIDGYGNLILLCADDHKRIDEQPELYTVDALHEIKAAHEAWAAERFAAEPDPEPIQVIKAPGEDLIPMTRILTGKQIWDLIEATAARYMRTAEGDIAPEAAIASDELLDAAGDWADISDTVKDHGFGAIREAQDGLQALLDEVTNHGLFVLGKRVIRTIRGGRSDPSPWPVAYLAVVTGEEYESFGDYTEL